MMAVFENFPYTNFHELNLDWIIKKVKDMKTEVEQVQITTDQELEDFRTYFQNELDELENLLNNQIMQYVEQYVDDHLSQFVVNATYDEATRTITLNE